MHYAVLSTYNIKQQNVYVLINNILLHSENEKRKLEKKTFSRFTNRLNNN